MKAVLDACALYPTVLREILTGAAQAGVFTPVWTPRIREEWLRAAARLGVAQTAGAEAALLADRFPPAPDPRVVPGIDLPDPADLHVLAAAIEADAPLIVTLNLRDFPRETLAPLGVRAIHPDAFLLDLLATHPQVAAAARAAHAKAEALGGPQPFRALMKRARLPRLAKAVEADA